MESYEIKEECIFFVNPGELHGIISESKSFNEEHAIVFQPGLLSFEAYDSAQMYLLNPLKKIMSFPFQDVFIQIIRLMLPFWIVLPM